MKLRKLEELIQVGDLVIHFFDHTRTRADKNSFKHLYTSECMGPGIVLEKRISRNYSSSRNKGNIFINKYEFKIYWTIRKRIDDPVGVTILHSILK